MPDNPIVRALADRARRSGAGAFLTWYRPETGARTELSVKTFANWVDKTANLLDTLGVTGLVSAPLDWSELPDVHPSDFTLLTMPERFASVGDKWAGMDDIEPGSLQTALEWFDRDAANGEGEMPYPPEYPKMPGEPPRVQPSKKNAANWE